MIHHLVPRPGPPTGKYGGVSPDFRRRTAGVAPKSRKGERCRPALLTDRGGVDQVTFMGEREFLMFLTFLGTVESRRVVPTLRR
jgi:hypothetical protein